MMDIKKFFGSSMEEFIPQESPEPAKPEKYLGKIFHLNEAEGWGFISSPDIKFTRIFFHWTALEQDTLHFTELRKGMKVEFDATKWEDKGWRALHVVVVE